MSSAPRPSSRPIQLSSAGSLPDGGPARRRTGRVIAVTGAAGFLGSNLVGSLEEDDRVHRIVAIDSTPTPNPRVGMPSRPAVKDPFVQKE